MDYNLSRITFHEPHGHLTHLNHNLRTIPYRQLQANLSKQQRSFGTLGTVARNVRTSINGKAILGKRHHQLYVCLTDNSQTAYENSLHNPL